MRLQRLLPWLGAVGLWVVALYALKFVMDAYALHPDGNLSAIVACLAALLALSGWMVQAFLSVRASRKQHSINVLFQSRMSAEFQRFAKDIATIYPDGVDFHPDDRHLPEKRDAYRAIIFMLNYYEFISVGMWHGDLDEAIMRDCIRSQFLSFTGRAEEIIRYARQEDRDGRPSTAKQLIFKSLRHRQRLWAADKMRRTGTYLPSGSQGLGRHQP